MNAFAITLSAILLCAAAANAHAVSKRSIPQFASMIRCATGRGALSYNGYGCWCGKGGSGYPVDATDRCCQAHDRCYDRIISSRLCPWKYNVYTVIYKTLGCFGCASVRRTARNNNICQYSVCHCDSTAVQCFRRNSFNSRFMKYDKRRCRAGRMYWDLAQLDM